MGDYAVFSPPVTQRFSIAEVAELVEPGTSVLDLGCGDGKLLEHLRDRRGCSGRGVDIEEGAIRACLEKGISVFQGDLDEGLKEYATGSYDYVILNGTLQVVREPAKLLMEMVRVGRLAIVDIPNFGFVVNRLQLVFRGRMPVNKDLPFQWHDTPNIHFCTRSDFIGLCNDLGIRIIRRVDMRRGRHVAPGTANLFATECCFVLEGSCESA